MAGVPTHVRVGQDVSARALHRTLRPRPACRGMREVRRWNSSKQQLIPAKTDQWNGLADASRHRHGHWARTAQTAQQPNPIRVAKNRSRPGGSAVALHRVDAYSGRVGEFSALRGRNYVAGRTRSVVAVAQPLD